MVNKDETLLKEDAIQ